MQANEVNLQNRCKIAAIKIMLTVALQVKSKNFLNFAFLVGKPHTRNSPSCISSNKNNRFIICRLIILGYFESKASRLVTKKCSLFIRKFFNSRIGE